MAATDTIYQNHLKNGYPVQRDAGALIITDTSCYQLSEETTWLIAGLPDNGGKELYFNALSGLGLNEPQKIFDKLVALGALREKEKRSWKDILGMILTPKIKLFSAQFQEKFFQFFEVRAVEINKVVQILAVISVLGLSWGAALLIAGPKNVLPISLTGEANGFVVFLLVMAGSLIHELGHSFAAMVSGIGLRPIGFSVYLIYPVFYTNVSGIEKVSLWKKVLIDCGGFVFQGVFLFMLLLLCTFTGSSTVAESARWIVVIVLFNLNPFFRTDGYWLYKDVYSEFNTRQWARTTHYLYLAAFAAFSGYFLWRICGRVGYIWHGLNMLMHSPRYFFSGGYRIVLCAYFILVGFAGGLGRFKEGHQEWKDLTNSQGE